MGAGQSGAGAYGRGVGSFLRSSSLRGTSRLIGAVRTRLGIPSRPLSRGAQLRAKYGGTFKEYMHFRNQGFSPAQSKYLTKPYGSRMGHHYPIPRRTGRDWGIPEEIVDSRFNVLNPRDISIGRFYELHYRVDPYFHGTRFPKAIGGSWRGSQLGLERYSGLQRMWLSLPGDLKGAAASGTTGGSGATYFSMLLGHEE